jgi:hypothetical protein
MLLLSILSLCFFGGGFFGLSVGADYQREVEKQFD